MTILIETKNHNKNKHFILKTKILSNNFYIDETIDDLSEITIKKKWKKTNKKRKSKYSSQFRIVIYPTLKIGYLFQDYPFEYKNLFQDHQIIFEGDLKFYVRLTHWFSFQTTFSSNYRPTKMSLDPRIECSFLTFIYQDFKFQLGYFSSFHEIYSSPILGIIIEYLFKTPIFVSIKILLAKSESDDLFLFNQPEITFQKLLEDYGFSIKPKNKKIYIPKKETYQIIARGKVAITIDWDWKSDLTTLFSIESLWPTENLTLFGYSYLINFIFKSKFYYKKSYSIDLNYRLIYHYLNDEEIAYRYTHKIYGNHRIKVNLMKIFLSHSFIFSTDSIIYPTVTVGASFMYKINSNLSLQLKMIGSLEIDSKKLTLEQYGFYAGLFLLFNP